MNIHDDSQRQNIFSAYTISAYFYDCNCNTGLHIDFLLDVSRSSSAFYDFRQRNQLNFQHPDNRRIYTIEIFCYTLQKVRFLKTLTAMKTIIAREGKSCQEGDPKNLL